MINSVGLLGTLIERWRANARYLRSQTSYPHEGADTQEFCANELEAALATLPQQQLETKLRAALDECLLTSGGPLFPKAKAAFEDLLAALPSVSPQLGTLIERWRKEIADDKTRTSFLHPRDTLRRCADELEAAIATLPQHSKDCAVWFGSSANPESESLPCDCGALPPVPPQTQEPLESRLTHARILLNVHGYLQSRENVRIKSRIAREKPPTMNPGYVSDEGDETEDDFPAASPPAQSQEPYFRRRFEIAQRAYDRLNLCSDHRDKANGRCIVCVAEERTKAELLAASPPAQQAQEPHALTVADINAIKALLERCAPSADGTAAWAERKRIAELTWKLTLLGQRIENQSKLAVSPPAQAQERATLLAEWNKEIREYGMWTSGHSIGARMAALLAALPPAQGWHAEKDKT